MCWSVPRGKEEQSRSSATVSKVWASDRPAAGRGLINSAASCTWHPAPVPCTLSPPIRRPSPAFEETCQFHQEVERSAPEERQTSPASASQAPALLQTRCGAGSSALSPLPPIPQWILLSQGLSPSFLATQTSYTVELSSNWTLAFEHLLCWALLASLSLTSFRNP